MGYLKALTLLSLLIALVNSRLLLPGHPKSSKELHTAPDPLPDPAAVTLAGVTGTSGMIRINSTTGSAMFFYQTNADGKDIASAQDTTPLVIWLQGGPGCSSMTGLFYELGPIQINPDTKQPEKRAVSWGNKYHLLFIDNPIGAGYSFAGQDSDYVTSYIQMADNLYYMLQQLATKYPTWFSNRDLFITGESYAGHWIPAITYKILNENKNAPISGNKVLPLKGIAIGDGWTDPYNQLQHYGDFGYSAGLIDQQQKATVEAQETQGRTKIAQGNYCDAQTNFDNLVGEIVTDGGNVNEYNIREFGSYDTTFIDDYLNLSTTKATLHVPDSATFDDCNNEAYVKLCTDFMNSVKTLFPYILNEIRVLLYNGQDDLIVATPTAENWIKNLVWNGQANYLDAEKSVWSVNGQVAGYARGYGNLTQLTMLKAGHMAPKDQPEASLDMITRFVENSGFSDE